MKKKEGNSVPQWRRKFDPFASNDSK